MGKGLRSDWLIVGGLIVLALIPVAAGAFRLTTLAAGVPVTPDNARFVTSPIPVTLHIVGTTIYALLGAFQFAPGFRRRHPAWHRRAGRVLVMAGLTAALSGLWMTEFYAIVPADHPLEHVLRLFAGGGMLVAILNGFAAIRRRDFGAHQDWMMRGYAIGMGAGTQALTQLPALLLFGPPDDFTRALLMGLAWGINITVAEWLIRRRRGRGGLFGHGAEDEGGDLVDRHLARLQRRIAGGRGVDVEADAVGAAELLGPEFHRFAARVHAAGHAVAAAVIGRGEIAERPAAQRAPDLGGGIGHGL